MLTLESLPRELHQDIFRIAFEHAIDRDIQLNDSLRNCILSDESAIMLRLKKWVPNRLTTMLGYSERFDQNYRAKSFAISIHNTAACLHVVFPGLCDDVDFILKKSLGAFSEMEARVLSKLKAKS